MSKTHVHEPFEIVDKRRVSNHAPDEPAEVVIEPAAPVLTSADRIYDDPVPIFDKVLVLQGKAETVYQGTTFIIPESAQKMPNVGVVVAAAEFFIVEGQKFPMSDLLKPGDMVRFSPFNFDEIEIDGEKFQIGSIFDIKLIHRVHYAFGEANAVSA
jgi:co-chaperonin GroES (HSP10)